MSWSRFNAAHIAAPSSEVVSPTFDDMNEYINDKLAHSDNPFRDGTLFLNIGKTQQNTALEIITRAQFGNILSAFEDLEVLFSADLPEFNVLKLEWNEMWQHLRHDCAYTIQDLRAGWYVHALWNILYTKDQFKESGFFHHLQDYINELIQNDGLQKLKKGDAQKAVSALGVLIDSFRSVGFVDVVKSIIFSMNESADSELPSAYFWSKAARQAIPIRTDLRQYGTKVWTREQINQAITTDELEMSNKHIHNTCNLPNNQLRNAHQQIINFPDDGDESDPYTLATIARAETLLNKTLDTPKIQHYITLSVNNANYHYDLPTTSMQPDNHETLVTVNVPANLRNKSLLEPTLYRRFYYCPEQQPLDMVENQRRFWLYDISRAGYENEGLESGMHTIICNDTNDQLTNKDLLDCTLSRYIYYVDSLEPGHNHPFQFRFSIEGLTQNDNRCHYLVANDTHDWLKHKTILSFYRDTDQQELVRAPLSAGTLATLEGVETLSNKSITEPYIAELDNNEPAILHDYKTMIPRMDPEQGMIQVPHYTRVRNTLPIRDGRLAILDDVSETADALTNDTMTRLTQAFDIAADSGSLLSNALSAYGALNRSNAESWIRSLIVGTVGGAVGGAAEDTLENLFAKYLTKDGAQAMWNKTFILDHYDWFSRNYSEFRSDSGDFKIKMHRVVRLEVPILSDLLELIGMEIKFEDEYGWMQFPWAKDQTLKLASESWVQSWVNGRNYINSTDVNRIYMPRETVEAMYAPIVGARMKLPQFYSAWTENGSIVESNPPFTFPLTNGGTITTEEWVQSRGYLTQAALTNPTFTTTWQESHEEEVEEEVDDGEGNITTVTTTKIVTEDKSATLTLPHKSGTIALTDDVDELRTLLSAALQRIQDLEDRLTAAGIN